jgi:hypothetical protein
MKLVRQIATTSAPRTGPHAGRTDLKISMPGLALHSSSKAIRIPASLRNQKLDVWPTSARLSAVLQRFGIHVLGDLHGRKVVDFIWEKNCGSKTLYELDLLAQRARFQNGKASCNRHPSGRPNPSRMPSYDFSPGDSEVATKMQEDAASFAIPESIRHLSFNELPITGRLANVARSIGARTLTDLQGRDAFELLQYKNCGWGVISEIQQLIDRAVNGEFDVGQIEETTAAAELVILLEQALIKLPLRDRKFVLARICGENRNGRSPHVANPSYLTYAEIGRRHGLTRARVHKAFGNVMEDLRKIWGPRMPRLLDVINRRCLSTICPLTPRLLEKWVDLPAESSPRRATRDGFSRFRLSAEAHVRLIAALDKSTPCWLETNLKHIDSSNGQFDLALERVVREAGGHITVAEVYRNFLYAGGSDDRWLTVQKFLRMLQSASCTVVEFTDPEVPIVRLRPSSAGVFPCEVSNRNGKPSNDPTRTEDFSAPDKQIGLTSMAAAVSGALRQHL